MYTSHYNPERSFAETRQGDFPIYVHGDWLPRQVFGGLHILFAMMRNVWLALCVAMSGVEYDIFFCDQVC
jgi:alpha-1,3/alpha-1,6-mannosyltransferase